jgi:diguanylate cyclase (GGDEF)-like protein
MVALLPEADEEGALVTAERLRQAVASLKLDHGGTTFRLTVSIGVARWQAFEPTIEAALATADRALYCVKNSGRNGVLFIAESSKDPTEAEQQYSAHRK